jgi:lipoprotein-anchoring transpeptidase ErfK/SrfK
MPRALAVGGAVVITALALAGSLGLGPGAKAAHDQAAQSSTPPAAVGTSTSSGPTDAASKHWLTVDKGPVSGDTSRGGGSTPNQAGDNTQHQGGSSTAPGSTSGPSSGSGSNATPPTTTSTPLPAHSGTGRRVVYDISAQRVWLVTANGSVQRTYLVSGSRQQDLVLPGTYTVQSRSEDAISFDHKETMHYMVRFTHGENSPIGFHDIPVRDTDGKLVQTRRQLGTPLSAGCIRQWEPDAKAMWRFAPVHTKVVVVA